MKGRNQIGNTPNPENYQKLMLKICKKICRSSVVTVPPKRAARTPEYIDTKGQVKAETQKPD